MDARTLEQAAATLAADRRRAVVALAFGLAAAALAGLLTLVSAPAAIALGAGAATELIVASAVELCRRESISRLALDADAYVLPEVMQYGTRVARLRERQRLAHWLQELVHDARLPCVFYLRERVVRHARDLEAIASALASPAATVHPASAVACLRLLTRTPQSPLYNDRLPADELALALRSIRSGITLE
jgi:hypothetical protein